MKLFPTVRDLHRKQVHVSSVPSPIAIDILMVRNGVLGLENPMDHHN